MRLYFVLTVRGRVRVNRRDGFESSVGIKDTGLVYVSDTFGFSVVNATQIFLLLRNRWRLCPNI